MSRLNDLIQELCHDGVEYRKAWEVTIWDKKFNSVDSHKQTKTIKYNYFLAKELDNLAVNNGDIKILKTSESNLYTNKKLVEEEMSEGEIVYIPWGGNAVVQYYKGSFITGDNRICTSYDTTILNNKYLYYIFKNKEELIASFYRGSGIKHPDMSKVLDIEIPIPPLEVQEEIVRILDTFTELTAELTAELNARKKQYEYYFDRLFRDINARTKVSFDSVAKIVRGASPRPIKNFVTENDNGFPWIKIGDVNPSSKYVTSTKEMITESGSAKSRIINPGDFIMSNSMSYGRPYISKIRGCIHDGWLSISDYTEHYTPDFLYYLLSTTYVQTYFDSKVSGGVVKNLNADIVKSLRLPIYTFDEQEKIVRILNKFDLLVNDIIDGLPAEIDKRKKQYGYYRDVLLNFNTIKTGDKR